MKDKGGGGAGGDRREGVCRHPFTEFHIWNHVHSTCLGMF